MESCNLIFRQAVSDDLDAVCGLYRTALTNPFSVWNEAYPSRIEAEHDLETGNLFVLTKGETLVGTISIVPESEMENIDIWQFPGETHKEIARIAVSTHYQGHGLAGFMVKEVFAVLKERGFESVRLSAACCNLPACKTYRKIGFEIRGEADLYGSHYYLMEIKL